MEPLGTKLTEALEETVREVARELGRELMREMRKADRSITSELYAVPEFAKISPFTKGALYKLTMDSESNGMEKSGALVRKSGRVYIHRARFEKWFATR